MQTVATCTDCGTDRTVVSSHKCPECGGTKVTIHPNPGDGVVHGSRPSTGALPVNNFVEQEWTADGQAYRKVVSGDTSRIERLVQENSFKPGKWTALPAGTTYPLPDGPDFEDGPEFEGWAERAGLGLPTEAFVRKGFPIFSGVLRYFPDALAAVAELSRIGNEQHNPGQSLHWARSKSGDEWDALTRHLLEVGTIDTDGVRHAAKVAWRALAGLQKEIELAAGVDKSDQD